MSTHWTPEGTHAVSVDTFACDTLLVGQSPRMMNLKQMIALVARSDAPVLIQGQTGVGKELVSQTLHRLSGRSGPLVALNCAAIPSDLLESELFGHEKGAFTGAVERRIGRVEQAQGGTLFLDEIGDMSPALQAKLLRVLESRTVQRLGGKSEIEVDFRLVTATHRTLAEDVVAGRFREDLFYRINVFPLEVPALKDRLDDIPLIRDHMQRNSDDAGYNQGGVRFTDDAIAALKRHDWPGNVRELRNVFDRASLLFAGRSVDAQAVRSVLLQAPLTARVQAAYHAIPAPRSETGTDAEEARALMRQDGSLDLRRYLQNVEVELIEAALELNDWCVSHAATALRLQRTTLIEKMKKLCITRKATA